MCHKSYTETFRDLEQFYFYYEGLDSAEKTGGTGDGGRVNLPGPSSPKKGPGSDYDGYVFVFLRTVFICRLYRLTFRRLMSTIVDVPHR